jgi:hypothetical protein
MDMEYKTFQMEIYTKDIMFKESLMVKANIVGQMEQHIKENF